MKTSLSWQPIGNRICECAFYFFYALLRLLPASVFRTIARPFLQAFIRVAIPRQRVMKNLSGAFGQSYTWATKKGLAKGVQLHFIENLLDCLTQLADPQYAKKLIAIRGMQHLDTALQKGKGVLALGAHIGNFVLLGTRLGLEGHRVHTLFRIPPDRRIGRLIAKFLPHYHQVVIPSLPRRAAVTRILDTLRRNEIVYVLGDNLKKGKINALFFGQQVPSPRGPVSLALRSGAPLVPLYLIRNYDGNMELVIEPEIPIKRKGHLGADISDSTKEVLSFLESLIRRYPDQWNWLTVRLHAYRRIVNPNDAIGANILREEEILEVERWSG